MSRRFIVFFLILCGAGALTAWASLTPATPVGVRDFGHSEANLAVTRTSPELTSISLQSPVVIRQDSTVNYQTYQLFGIAGEPFTPAEGSPAVPQVSRFYRIPNTGGADLVINNAEYDVIDNVNPFPIQPIEQTFQTLSRNEAVYAADAWYPANVAEMSAPMIMRDFRVVTVTLYPVQVNPVTHQARIYRNLSVDVVANNRPGVNELTNPRQPSGAWAEVYRSMIANLDDNALDDVTTTPGSIIILTSDNSGIREWADSLAEWKTRKGYKVTIDVRSSWSSSQAYNDIHSAYLTANPPLEFAILMGDPGWSNVGIPVGSSNNFDHYYASQTSDDIEDIGVGRLSGSSWAAMAQINAKIMAYERAPMSADTNWYHKAYLLAGVGNNCAGNYLLMRWGQDQFTHNTGVNNVTVAQHNGSMTAGDIQALQTAVNNGIGYMLWRGSWQFQMPSDIADATNPAGRFPICMTITCNAGDYTSNGPNGPAEDWLCPANSTANNPLGGVAGMGTATAGTENGANVILASGMIYAIADMQVEHLGTAVNSAKAQLYSSYGANFPDPEYDPRGLAGKFSALFNLLGDPSLSMWTDAPEALSVSHPTSVNVGTRSIDVTVRRAADNAFVQDALVVLWKKGTDSTWVKGLTDATGHITLPVSINTTGSLYLTVTKRNCKPYLYTINCNQAGAMPMINSYVVDDDNTGGTQGNGDHLMNPGETIDLPVYIKNFGNSGTVTGITATMASNSSEVTVVSGSANYNNLAPGDSALGSTPFRISVSPDLQNNVQVLLNVTINSSAGTAVGTIPLTCRAGMTVYQRQYLSPAFVPGGTTNLTVVVQNTGTVGLTGVNAHLVSLSSFVTVTDANASYGTIAAGALDSNNTDALTLAADGNAFRGHQAPMLLILTSSTGFVDTVQFVVPVGTAQSNDPTGPDGYGYYAYDNTDSTYNLHPVFNYVNISGISGTNLNLDDTGEKTSPTPIWATVRTLPFGFKFYGRVYSQITMCSNGWCAFGDQSYMDLFRNYQIPAMSAPEALIAPYWDDLMTSGTGLGVFAYSDVANHRYIIQWKAMGWSNSCGTYGNYYTAPLDFEVILYDTTYAPTPDGNGRVVLQYNQVTMNLQNQYCDEATGCTIGLQAPGGLIGMQYAYQAAYSPGAATVQNGRAILFTTAVATNAPLPLTLVGPNGGAVWYQNTSNVVSWFGGNPTHHIRVDLSRSGNAGPWETVIASTANNGTYIFTVNGPTSTNCFVKVSSVESTTDADTSNGAFSISSLRLTSPNGGDVWSVDSSETITWQGGSTAASVRIELSRTGANGPWQVLNSSAPNTGSYTFTVTAPSSSRCRVRVTSLSDATDTDASDANFTIEAIQSVFSQGFEGGTDGWSHNTVGAWHDNWNLSTERAHTGTTSYKCGDTGTGQYSNNCDARLMSPVITNLPANATLQFYHQIQSEVSGASPDSAYDGGILEIAVNGGAFTEMTPASGYPKTFRYWRNSNGDTATGPMRGMPCWADTVSNPAWSQVSVDLSSYAQQSIQLRWRFGSDSTTAREGWYVDDVQIFAPVVAPPEPLVPVSVTCISSGNDVILRWDADGNTAYRIYSSANVTGPYDTLEGSTTSTTYTIPNAAGSNLKRFYIVVGWDGQ